MHAGSGQRQATRYALKLARLTLAGLFVSPAVFAEPPAERQQALLQLLRQDCGSCHGMTLQGGLGPALLPATLAGKSDETLIATIIEGRAGTAMPPWKSFMSRDEAQWLVSQLRKPGLGPTP
jgi:cytochrome c55X